MARKFEVGQKVKIRQWDDMEKEFGLNLIGSINCYRSFVETMKNFCGRIATIKEILSDGTVILDFEDKSANISSWEYSTDMIEPCVYIPTFEELVGKVVEARDGRRYLGVKTENEGIIFTGVSGWFAASDRNENLLSRYGKGLDIMKVYEPKYGYYFSEVLNSASTLIWERKEVEEVKEMTVADVEKLVGCKVKVVKG